MVDVAEAPLVPSGPVSVAMLEILCFRMVVGIVIHRGGGSAPNMVIIDFICKGSLAIP